MGINAINACQMLQNLENSWVPSLIFLVKSSHFAPDLHYSGSTGELQDAVPLPNLDSRSSMIFRCHPPTAIRETWLHSCF